MDGSEHIDYAVRKTDVKERKARQKRPLTLAFQNMINVSFETP